MPTSDLIVVFVCQDCFIIICVSLTPSNFHFIFFLVLYDLGDVAVYAVFQGFKDVVVSLRSQLWSAK